MALEPVLDEIVRRIVDTLHPERVYLFGSQARGDARPDSDYDVLVLVREMKESHHTYWTRAQEAIWAAKTLPEVDIHIWPIDKFDRWAHLAAELPATVLREGRLIYAA